MAIPLTFASFNLPMNDTTVRLHAWISGKVQGVGYRLSTLNQAKQSDVKGWVRNLADGRVEVVLEGDRANVDRLLAWCRQGPPAAGVRDVETVEEQPQGLQDFEVLR